MKKLILTLLLLGVYAGLHAQEGFKFGFRFSPLVSWATILDAETKDRLELGQSSRLGFAYGLVANYGFTENYAFNSGFHIVSKGYTSVDTANAEVDTRITTLEIPVGIKLRSNDLGEGLFVKGLFGASLDINTGYKQTIGDQESRNTNRINPIASTFFFGGGLEIESEKAGTFDLGISFHRGLTNVNNKENGYPAGYPLPNTLVRISYLSFDLGYSF